MATPYQTYIDVAVTHVQNMRPDSVVSAMVPTIFQSESGGDPNQTNLASSATGLGQMLVSTARGIAATLGLKTQFDAMTDAQVVAALKDPYLNTTFSMQNMVNLENQILGWPEVQRSGLANNTPALQAVIAAAVAGPKAMSTRAMVNQALATTNGSWNDQTTSNFVAIFNTVSQAQNRSQFGPNAGPSPSVGKLAGAGGSLPSPTTPGQIAGAGGFTPGSMGQASAPASTAPPLNNPGTTQNPQALKDIIEDGLDVGAWFDSTWANYGGVSPTGNPDMRQSLDTPASFSLALDQGMRTSLTDKTGKIIQIILNVGLQSVNIRSQQLVHRTPTATGLMMTFWGSQPDTITGRGSTGLMRNAFGLTALGSNRLTPVSSEFYDALLDAYPNAGSDGIAEPWSTPNALRVAAQDAFAELLLLFKNNGVLRFLPPEFVPEQRAPNGSPLWSPSEGATGYQMAARTGDVRRRGYVVFKYRQASYMGYFKSLNLTADANTPFTWNFDFTFRVERSVLPVFKFGSF